MFVVTSRAFQPIAALQYQPFDANVACRHLVRRGVRTRHRCVCANSSYLRLGDGASQLGGRVRVCRQNNNTGHLAYPDNAEEAADLLDLLLSANVSQVHVGLHDQFSEGTYLTIKGQPIDDTCYSEWAPGYPQGGSGNNCGGFTPEGLIDVNCDEPQPFVCEENLNFEYDLIPGVGYYKYHFGLFTWFDAHRICAFEKAHMLILNSDEEFLALLNLYEFTVVWVGLQHILVDRQFVTIFDLPMEETGFSRWSSGEPSGTNVDYPYVGLIDEGYFIEGDRGYNFICERDLV